MKLEKHLNFRCGTESKLKLFSINTNQEELFELHKQKSSEALVSAEVCRELAQKTGEYFDEEKELVGNPREIALYAAKTTDILLIEVDEIPDGISPDQRNIYWRSALYSFGFLLRQYAASLLDVSPSELRVEIRPVEEGENRKQQIFLADSLANGAGYCRHLGELDDTGQPFRLVQLLREMTDSNLDFARELIAHGKDCDSSCYRCMRDYLNMPYHPFLDWRLGLDLAHLCLEKDYPIDLQKYWSPLVDRVAENLAKLIEGLERKDRYGVPVFEVQSRNKAFVLHHPLALQLAPVIADFDGSSFDLKYINIFDAIRRVSLVMNELA